MRSSGCIFLQETKPCWKRLHSEWSWAAMKYFFFESIQMLSPTSKRSNIQGQSTGQALFLQSGVDQEWGELTLVSFQLHSRPGRYMFLVVPWNSAKSDHLGTSQSRVNESLNNAKFSYQVSKARQSIRFINTKSVTDIGSTRSFSRMQNRSLKNLISCLWSDSDIFSWRAWWEIMLSS